MLARLFSLTILLALCFIPAQAQNKPGAAPVKLAWHFTKGSEFHFRQCVSIKQLSDSGMDKEETSQKSTQREKHEVLDVDEKNVSTIKVTYLRSQFESKGRTGKTVNYDSANPEDESKLEDLNCKVMQAYVNCSFVYTVDAAGNILEVKDCEDLLKKLSNILGTREAAEEAAGPASIKRSLQMAFGILPENEVAKGDSWNRVFEEPAHLLGTVRYELTCTYKGIKQVRGYNAAHIVIDSEPKLIPAEKKDDALKDFEFKMSEASFKGNYYFLPTSSQFLKSEFTQHLVIGISGMGLNMSIGSDTLSERALLTQDDLKAEEAEIKALREDKKYAPPEGEEKPAPEPVK